jgi:hypothetical protein
MKCPHCSEPLVIRAYFERFEDCEADTSEGYLNAGRVINSDNTDADEYSDYECSNCKENVTDMIGESIDVLKEKYPAMFA